MQSKSTVIASAAKQSNRVAAVKKAWIATSLTLLAMTAIAMMFA